MNVRLPSNENAGIIAVFVENEAISSLCNVFLMICRPYHEHTLDRSVGNIGYGTLNVYLSRRKYDIIEHTLENQHI